MHLHTYLALGDSYTIGEAVLLHQSFPYQTVQKLRQKGFSFAAPEVLARTGWTTDELDAAMRSYRFLPRYDFVSLLVGVNNQYRGRDAIEFKEQFEELLKKSLALSGGRKDRVFVLSIPDYANTPFAASLDREKISKEIDVFNAIQKALSIQYKVHYIDNTQKARADQPVEESLASDGLHPSEQEYARWSEPLAAGIASVLK